MPLSQSFIHIYMHVHTHNCIHILTNAHPHTFLSIIFFFFSCATSFSAICFTLWNYPLSFQAPPPFFQYILSPCQAPCQMLRTQRRVSQGSCLRELTFRHVEWRGCDSARCWALPAPLATLHTWPVSLGSPLYMLTACSLISLSAPSNLYRKNTVARERRPHGKTWLLSRQQVQGRQTPSVLNQQPTGVNPP